MIPKSSNYREQHLECCATCQHNVDVNGITVMVCGFGEELHQDSFFDDLRSEEAKYYRAGDNYFDHADFGDKWLKERWVHESNICNHYAARITNNAKV